MDKRSKKIIFCVHCLLNQNARAKGVAKCPGAVPEFLEYCVKNGYGIVPIDCPQLRFEPLERKPEAKEHYDNRESRNISLGIIDDVISQIKNYLKNGYEVCGIYGVEGSPTCGAIKTHITNESGNVVSVFESGIFFEELKKRMFKKKLDVKIFDWDIQAKKRIY